LKNKKTEKISESEPPDPISLPPTQAKTSLKPSIEQRHKVYIYLTGSMPGHYISSSCMSVNTSHVCHCTNTLPSSIHGKP